MYYLDETTKQKEFSEIISFNERENLFECFNNINNSTPIDTMKNYYQQTKTEFANNLRLETNKGEKILIDEKYIDNDGIYLYFGHKSINKNFRAYKIPLFTANIKIYDKNNSIIIEITFSENMSFKLSIPKDNIKVINDNYKSLISSLDEYNKIRQNTLNNLKKASNRNICAIIGIILFVISILLVFGVLIYCDTDSTPSSKCPMCHGSGEIREDGEWVKCPTCLGTGKDFTK